MVLLYCSTIYGIVVSYLHLLSTPTLLIGFLGILLIRWKKGGADSPFIKALYSFAQLMNILLIFGAIVRLA